MQAVQIDNPWRVHIRVVSALIRREMAARYGRSALGYFWAVAEPLGMIALLSVVFSLVSRTPSLGQAFPVFFATGFLSYQFWKQSEGAGSSSFNFNKRLLSYPCVTLWDSFVARITLAVVTHIFVTVLILGGTVTIFDERVRIDLVHMTLTVGSVVLLGAGIGLINTTLFGLMPSWQRIYNILTRPLFIISGIFFIPEDLPGAVQDVIAWNPLTHVICAFRASVYPTYDPVIGNIGYPAAVGAFALLAGLMVLRRWERRLVDT